VKAVREQGRLENVYKIEKWEKCNECARQGSLPWNRQQTGTLRTYNITASVVSQTSTRCGRYCQDCSLRTLPRPLTLQLSNVKSRWVSVCTLQSSVLSDANCKASRRWLRRRQISMSSALLSTCCTALHQRGTASVQRWGRFTARKIFRFVAGVDFPTGRRHNIRRGRLTEEGGSISWHRQTKQISGITGQLPDYNRIQIFPRNIQSCLLGFGSYNSLNQS